MERLDEALIRPGRIDIRAKLGKATQSQAAELFIKFFPQPVATTDSLSSSTDTTTSTAAPRSGRRQSVGYEGDVPSPSTASSGESSPLLSEKPGSPTLSLSAPSTSKPGRTHKEIERMAAQFSKVIPDKQFSIAQLQGFLMGYKKTPELAVKHADEYVRQAGSAEVSGTTKIGHDDDEEDVSDGGSDAGSEASGKGKAVAGDGKGEKQDYYWEGSEEQQKERKDFREEKERERRASLK